jgi:sugar phosphate isomerase/epimerase
MGIPVALQLYTVRDELAKDFLGTLERVAGMGYIGVEFAGYGGIAAGPLKGHLERLGLMPVGSHVDLALLQKDLDSVIAFNAELGNPYIVCPWAEIKDAAGVERYAGLFNAIGEKIQSAGFEFCYHNHSHEFTRVGGEYALDLLFKRTDPSLVEIEFDTCWIHAAGADPTTYIENYAGRCPLIHLKDMKSGGGKQLTEIGAGVVDVKGIVRAAEESAVEWLIVEQDACERPSLESARVSLENMKRLGIA